VCQEGFSVPVTQPVAIRNGWRIERSTVILHDSAGLEVGQNKWKEFRSVIHGWLEERSKLAEHTVG
jgi:hypothetical protein